MFYTKCTFDNDKNKYILKINDKTLELTREEAVNLHNSLNRVLKATPQLFNSNIEGKKDEN
ncbi:hypothetical protein [Aliarcobacter butzleri]|uniref:hypothetical protein n=1 Tax=Aliarcobacter butzleri TaxID=28197 RepID=UPI001EDA8749|nr:hypothetical protein [Aliarcobacter butzleri]MCG3686492.1 hypothetical protein [Aliarcobacter butzleri]MCG3711544.1 hypothetical protein [Aliarcobacter butzleri]MCG3713996.1 hypothetical protein [Aliarcobacter butzleri]